MEIVRKEKIYNDEKVTEINFEKKFPDKFGLVRTASEQKILLIEAKENIVEKPT